MDGEIVYLNKESRALSLAETNERIGVIHHFTKPLAAKVEALISQMDAFGPDSPDKTSILEIEVEALIESWNGKVKKLGGNPKGLWLVDFDSGDGYFCWKFPETEINFWHEYKSGFPGRIALEDRERNKKVRAVDPIEEIIDRL